MLCCFSVPAARGRVERCGRARLVGERGARKLAAKHADARSLPRPASRSFARSQASAASVLRAVPCPSHAPAPVARRCSQVAAGGAERTDKLREGCKVVLDLHTAHLNELPRDQDLRGRSAASAAGWQGARRCGRRREAQRDAGEACESAGGAPCPAWSAHPPTSTPGSVAGRAVRWPALCRCAQQNAALIFLSALPCPRSSAPFPPCILSYVCAAYQAVCLGACFCGVCERAVWRRLLCDR